MKINLKKVITFLLITICLVCSTGCVNKKSEEQKVLNRILTRTTVEVPTTGEILYNLYINSFQSYIQYTCFKFNEQPVEFLNSYSFVDEKNEEFEWSFNAFFVGWRNGADVPEEYKIDFSRDYLWLRTGNNFLVFYPRENVLVVYLTGF